MSSGEKQRRYVLKPFKQHAPMGEAEAVRIWGSLKEAIGEIYNKNASVLSFEELYRNAYNLVLHKHGDLLYEGVRGTIRERVERVAERLRATGDEQLIGEVCAVWEEHKTTMEMVKDILMYMDRTYASQQRKLPVYELGLVEFREAIRETSRSRLQALLLEAVRRERSYSGLVDRSALKTALHMLAQLGAVDSSPVYEEHFEKQFLEESRAFYQREAAESLAALSCVEYVRRVEVRLAEEDRDYLHPSTRPKIVRLTERELVETHSSALVEGFCACLGAAEEKMEELRRMRNLFARCAATMDQLREALYEHVRAEGEALASDEPAALVRALLAMRDKYHAVVDDALRAETAAQKKLKDAFEGFINRDTKCAHALVVYVDELMRSKQLSEAHVDDALDRVIVIFRYIQDKDVFEDVYKQYLAKRLLSQRSVSHEYERAMLAKFKSECGYQFTTKLEGMFADVRFSKDVMDKYHHHQTTPELEVTMLTQGFWPIPNAHRSRLPPVVDERCVAPFEDFYLRLHSGRKLSWQTSQGTADVVRHQPGTPPVKHELTVSTHQMCVLLLFNDRPVLSFADILAATQIHPVAELKRHVVSLCTPKHRILLKKSKGKGVADDDEFTANPNFHSKLKRVKVPLVAAKESNANRAAGAALGANGAGASGATQTDGLTRAVEEDRRHLVEANVVRIMKARKQLQHNDLIAEVTRQLTQRFYPQPHFIKKCIESLLDREYIERSDSDSRIYKYLA
mmetsp:Transcript_11464/g.36419  ORF Transcript_11464/g.36419 Transcript_11464/m.36419 type:complete len:742 (+) Transcript_11464:99-2324(+)